MVKLVSKTTKKKVPLKNILSNKTHTHDSISTAFLSNRVEIHPESKLIRDIEFTKFLHICNNVDLVNNFVKDTYLQKEYDHRAESSSKFIRSSKSLEEFSRRS